MTPPVKTRTEKRTIAHDKKMAAIKAEKKIAAKALKRSKLALDAERAEKAAANLQIQGEIIPMETRIRTYLEKWDTDTTNWKYHQVCLVSNS
jgi:hypothetical protein